MNSTKINCKENKGKKKAFPKLKAILATPDRTKCPVLDETELVHLKFLLQSAIQESNLEPKAFATKSGICLGLESSLRKINNQTSSCVFISSSIKPSYVINLVARNAQFKDETQPVYVQPKLENFIQDIFSVQSLCMVFPNNLLVVNERLNSWVQERRKPEKNKNILLGTNKIHKKKSIKRKVARHVKIENSATKSDHIKKESEANLEKNLHSWSGEFISFKHNNPKTISKLDGSEAVAALTEIIDKLPTSTRTIVKDEQTPEPMEVDRISCPPISKIDDDTESDDFLAEYKALTVHKIRGNPNKNPKKKRKKRAKKNEIKK